MPVIKSAIKKLRRDRKREKENEAFATRMERAIKAGRKTQSKKDVAAAFSLLDKAVKKHLIHKNKAARLKSNLVKNDKLKTPAPAKKTPASTTPKTAPKSTLKKPKTTTRKSK